MARLLELACHPASTAARKVMLAPILWDSTDHDRARCEAIRRLAPVPPTLDELLVGYTPGLLAFCTSVPVAIGLDGCRPPRRGAAVHSLPEQA